MNLSTPFPVVLSASKYKDIMENPNNKYSFDLLVEQNT